MDIYAFGTLLVEIAEWAPLTDIIKNKISINQKTSTEEIARVRQYLLNRNVAFRMGTIYREVTMNCLGGNICDETESYVDQEAVVRDNFYGKVVRELEKCVI